MKPNLVLVGNGIAGIRTIEELLKLAPNKYNITVFGEEPYGNYNRTMLSPVLANEKALDDLILNDDGWYKENNVRFEKGRKVIEIHRTRKEVTAEDGTTAPYDKLLLATGSTPYMLPLPGADKYGVLGFRDVNDVDTLIEAAEYYKQAVVVGGGVLGLETAYGLLKQGMDVTLVHLSDRLMERQLDETTAKMLQNSLEAKGIKFLMSHATQEILGDERVTGIKFSDGSTLNTDLLVMAVGTKPNVALAKESGLHCEEGVVVNDTMQTFDPNIYSVGECAQHRGTTYAVVAPLLEQAKVAANHLAEFGFSGYRGSVSSVRLKIDGIDLFSAGDVIGNETTEELLLHDVANGTYKRLILRGDIITGVCLYGDTIDAKWYLQMMQDETNVADFRSTLIFGETHLVNASNDDSTNSPLHDESARPASGTQKTASQAVVTPTIATSKMARTS